LWKPTWKKTYKNDEWHMTQFSIFISSVQKEFARERRALKDYILNEPSGSESRFTAYPPPVSS